MPSGEAWSISDDTTRPCKRPRPKINTPLSKAERTYISELDFAEFAQSADGLAPNVPGKVQLDQGHLRRAEQRVLVCRHDGASIVVGVGATTFPFARVFDSYKARSLAAVGKKFLAASPSDQRVCGQRRVSRQWYR